MFFSKKRICSVICGDSQDHTVNESVSILCRDVRKVFTEGNHYFQITLS